MHLQFISCIPILVLIVGTLLTKRLTEMLLVSTLLGAVLAFGGNWFNGYVDMIYSALSNSTLQYILILLTTFGGFIALLEETGALKGFGQIFEKFAKNKKRTLIATWIMGLLLFIDDFLCALATSYSMKHVTDKQRIPREHLALSVNSFGAGLAVLVPISSWGAFAIATGKDYGVTVSSYMEAVPFMFFPIICIIGSLLLALGVIPKVGALKKAYERVDNGGPLLEGDDSQSAELAAVDEIKSAPAYNFIIPIVVLIVVMILCNNDMIHGMLAALAVQLIMYLAQKRITLSQFFEVFFNGVNDMTSTMIILTLAFMLAAANDELQFSAFITNLIGGSINPALLPAIVFVLLALLTFSAQSFWVMIMLAMPIFIPMVTSQGLNPAPIIGAIISGVIVGTKTCPFAETVLMTASGTGVDSMGQLKVVSPYVLTAAAIATVGFLITGFVMY